MTGIHIRAANKGDIEAVRALLLRCELTLDGLEDQFGGSYAVAESGGVLAGVAGIEAHGHCGLLRSVAVAPELQGRGLGRLLVADRLAWARSRGVAPVYLLTTTAASYFEKLGFKPIGRDAVSVEIRGCAEFAHACPLSATVMISKPE